MPFSPDRTHYTYRGKSYQVEKSGNANTATVFVNLKTSEPWDGSGEKEEINLSAIRDRVMRILKADIIHRQQHTKHRVKINGKEEVLSAQSIRARRSKYKKRGLDFNLEYLDLPKPVGKAAVNINASAVECRNQDTISETASYRSRSLEGKEDQLQCVTINGADPLNVSESALLIAGDIMRNIGLPFNVESASPTEINKQPDVIPSGYVKIQEKLYPIATQGNYLTGTVFVEPNTTEPWKGVGDAEEINKKILSNKIYRQRNNQAIRARSLAKHHVRINGEEKTISEENIRNLKRKYLKQGLPFNIEYLDGMPEYKKRIAIRKNAHQVSNNVENPALDLTLPILPTNELLFFGADHAERSIFPVYDPEEVVQVFNGTTSAYARLMGLPSSPLMFSASDFIEENIDNMDIIPRQGI